MIRTVIAHAGWALLVAATVGTNGTDAAGPSGQEPHRTSTEHLVANAADAQARRQLAEYVLPKLIERHENGGRRGEKRPPTPSRPKRPDTSPQKASA